MKCEGSGFVPQELYYVLSKARVDQSPWVFRKYIGIYGIRQHGDMKN